QTTRAWAVPAHFQAACRPAHRHRLDLRAAFWPRHFEERTHLGPWTPTALALHVDHDRGAAMPLPGHELIQRAPPQAIRVHRTHGTLQGPKVDRPGRLPVDVASLRGVAHRGCRA